MADSLSAIVAITNHLAPEFGYQPTAPEEIDTLKGMNARQIIWRSQIPLLKIPALLRRVRSELQTQGAELAPCPGIPAVIQTLHQQQHTLAIVTSNSPHTVHAFLAAHQLQRYFVSVDGGGTLFGKGRLIVRCLQRHQFDPARTIYVGDEVRDLEAARFAGIRSVAVTWGFNTRETLAAAAPDWVVDHPETLQTIADEV